MRVRTVAILRGFDPARTIALAQSCWAAGIDLVEVPVQDPAGWSALQAVADHADGRPFGAGTVLTARDVARATGLGASAIISPGIDAVVVDAARAAGALPLPGVMTPTDVARAAVLGLRTCKLFPADLVGPGWLKAMRGPFPSMRFIAVGGVDLGNAGDFLRAGACGIAFGSSIALLLELADPAGYVQELHGLVHTDEETDLSPPSGSADSE